MFVQLLNKIKRPKLLKNVMTRCWTNVRLTWLVENWNKFFLSLPSFQFFHCPFYSPIYWAHSHPYLASLLVKYKLSKERWKSYFSFFPLCDDQGVFLAIRSLELDIGWRSHFQSYFLLVTVELDRICDQTHPVTKVFRLDIF